MRSKGYSPPRLTIGSETTWRGTRFPGYAIATLSTKHTGVPPGDVTDAQMDAVADWADAYGFGEIRIGHEQNFVLPDMPQEKTLRTCGGARKRWPSQPPTSVCSRISFAVPAAITARWPTRSRIPIAEAIQRRYDDYDYLHDLGPIDLNISGCMNACGHHHVGHIGILGVDKKGAEFYQVSLGGHSGADASLGKIIGPSFARDDVPQVVEQILDVYVHRRIEEEPFLSCFRRIGMQPFKERVYAGAR